MNSTSAEAVMHPRGVAGAQAVWPERQELIVWYG